MSETTTPEAELVLIVPLLARAQACVGRRVTLWIPGGMRLSGRLLEIDEDALTLTVADGADRYDVALGSVAVIESRQQ